MRTVTPEGDDRAGEASEGSGTDAFWAGLIRAIDARRLRRVCFQFTVSPGVLERAAVTIRGLRALRPTLPVSVSVAARSLDEIGSILGWGVDRVAVALDAVTPELHAAVKGGGFEARLGLLRDAARAYPGHISTHLIVGLGETEEALVRLAGELVDLGIAVALFAFTPVPGTRLHDLRPPDLGAYRRMQAARFLMVNGYTRADSMFFDAEGRLGGYGLPWEKVQALLASGEAFRTSGCPDCNRPYYNERPSGRLYNYPRLLTAAEAEAAVAEAGPLETTKAGARDMNRPAAEGESATEVDGPRVPSAVCWRLIVEDQPRTGAWNMAIDEAILLAHAAGRVGPTLRFYRWQPPAVSLGYFQDRTTEVDEAACRQAGVDILRRLTGGRAVFHDQEITYSVVVSLDLLPGAVVETYRRIAVGLVHGLRSLGLDAVLAPEKAVSAARPGAATACFEVPSAYEILVDGKKVVGSAQVRRAGVLLQHGSIPLRLDPALLARLLGFPPEAAARIADRAIGLEAALARSDQPGGGTTRPRRQLPGFAGICRALADGLGQALGLTFASGGLTPLETTAAERLVRERYTESGWNLRRPEGRPDTETEEE